MSSFCASKKVNQFSCRSRGEHLAIMADSKYIAEIPNPVVLAVGNVYDWNQAARTLPPGSAVTFSDISDIKAEFLREICPDIVLSCLVCRDFDFLDLAQALQDAHYKGSLRIIVPKLPNPNSVISEARALCPDLQIEFYVDPTERGGAIN